MHKIVTIIKREIMTKVFTRGFIVGTVLGPIFMIGISFGPAFFMSLSEEKSMSLVIVDHTDQLSPHLPDAFSDTLANGQPRFILTIIDSTTYEHQRALFLQQLEDMQLKAVVIIPANAWEGGTLIYMGKSISDMEFIQLVRDRINQELNRLKLYRAGINPDIIKQLSTRLKIKTIKIEKGQAREKQLGQEWITAFVFLIILYMTSLLYGNATMRGVLEEKTSRIMEVLLSSTNAFQLMMGKVFGVGMVGLIQYLLWVAMALGVFAFAAASNPALLQYISISPTVFFYFIVFFLVGYFQISTLYAAVGAMSSSQEDAQALSTPITILVVIPFIISFTVIRDPASTLVQVLSFVPFFTPMLMFLRITLMMPPWYEIWGAIFVNLLAIVAGTWVSAKIYRTGILLYGKRPTLPEIIRWIRHQ